MMTEPPTQTEELTFDVQSGEGRILKTTIYDDQAEVKRILSFKPTAGATLVKLRGLPSTINSSSLRAEVVSKNAKLLEVSQSSAWEKGTPDPELERRLDEISVEQKKLGKRLERVNFRRDKMESHKNSILSALNGNEIGASSQVVLNPSVFEKLNTALGFYEKAHVQIKRDLASIDEQQVKLREEAKLLQFDKQKQSERKFVRVANVLVDIPDIVAKKSKATVDIELSYLVSGASWSASYDIRVDKGIENVILTYYGEVTNNTTEDWVEVDMELSTAKPSVGGAPPILARKLVELQSTYQLNNQMLENRFAIRQARNEGVRSLALSVSSTLESLDELPESALGYGGIGQTIPAAVASGDSGATLIKLQRFANIDSDNKPHKQTIVRVILDAELSHACAPRVSQNVYLKCASSNTTAFPFLKGTMGVFIDGSFVSNSVMNLVRPNERFSMFLGIDDAITLNYSPENVTTKLISSGGLMKSSKKWNKTVGRDISLVNNSANTINCLIYQQIPLPKDGKIKVEVKKPDIKKAPASQYMINKYNHLEAKTKVGVGEKFAMTVEYVLEWPENIEIDLVEKKKT